jgi:hypothetical protein
VNGRAYECRSTATAELAWRTDAPIDQVPELLEMTTEPVENIGHFTRFAAPIRSGRPSLGDSGPHRRSTDRCFAIGHLWFPSRSRPRSRHTWVGLRDAQVFG